MFKYILGVQKIMSYFMSSPPVTEKVPSTKKIDTFIYHKYIFKNVIVPGRYAFFLMMIYNSPPFVHQFCFHSLFLYSSKKKGRTVQKVAYCESSF